MFRKVLMVWMLAVAVAAVAVLAPGVLLAQNPDAALVRPG